MNLNNSLPNNRKNQVKHIIKFRWKAFMLLGGVLSLFALPLLASFLIKDLKAISIVTTSGENADLNTLIINDIFYSVFIVPSSVMFFIGLSGIFRIIRNYLWGEGVIFGSDFFIGIKQNWKHFTINGFIFSALFYGLYLSVVYIDVPFIKYLPLAFCLLFIYPTILVHMNLTVIYKNNYFTQFKNAFILYVKKFYIYFPLFLLLIAIPLVFLFLQIPLIVKYIVLFVFIYLFITFYFLIFNAFSMSVFDENINKERHPELYKKGLFL